MGFTYNPQDPSIPGYGLAYFYDMQTGEGDDLFFRSHIDGYRAQTTYGYKRYWHDVILYIHADQQTYGGLFLEWGM